MLRSLRPTLQRYWDDLLVWFYKLIGLQSKFQYKLTFVQQEDLAKIPLDRVARDPGLYYLAIEHGILDVRVTLPTGQTRTGEEAWRLICGCVQPSNFFVFAEYDTKFFTAGGARYDMASYVDTSEEIDKVVITGAFTANTL